jgi:glycine betaine/proline transport system substrate-binding protein
VWAGVKEKWPGAYAAIKAFRVTNDEMGEMIGRVDLEGQSVEVVVAGWMAKNEDRWKAWIGR